MTACTLLRSNLALPESPMSSVLQPMVTSSRLPTRMRIDPRSAELVTKRYVRLDNRVQIITIA
jgi:hypothetical protein